MLFHFRPKTAILTFVIFGNIFFPNLVLAQVSSPNHQRSVQTEATRFNLSKNSIRFPVEQKSDPEFFYKNSVEQILNRMSLDEKVGQLLIVGFPQDRLDDKLARHISRNKIGSFLVFKRNILSLVQLKELNQNLAKYSLDNLRIPPLMAIDQEGGNVTRITTNPKLPFLFHFGDLTDTTFSYNYGYYTGQLLSSLGFNLNLAPVLDLADFNSNRFISLRSFGSDPNRTALNGYAYSNGLQIQKVIPTAKHFPGLGSAVLDPHNAVLSNFSSMEEFEKNELVPFREFSKLGPHSAVMMSHMLYKGLDRSGVPASFSSFLMKDVLRKRIGFSGVIVTDDLHMKASSNTTSPAEAALKSLLAGSDLVMLSWSFGEQSKAFDLIKQAVLKKEFGLEELNEKVRRILILKKFVSVPVQKQNANSPQRSIASVRVEDNKNILDSSSFQSLIKSVLDKKLKSVFFKPQLEEKKLLCLISDQQQLFNLIGKKDSKVFKGFHYPKLAAAKSLGLFIKSSDCDLFMITVENSMHASVLNEIAELSDKKVVVINYVIPTMVKNRSRYFSILDLYGLNIKTEELLADKISEFTDMILRGHFRSAANSN